MKKLINRVRELLESSPVLRNILTLFSGTIIAQAATMVLAIFLARMFGPEQFGRLGIYNSVVALLVAIASLRFDMTMMLPKRDVEARVLKNLSSWSIIIVAIAASIGGFLAQDWITERYGGDEELGQLFPFLGLSVFLIAEVAVLQYWYNRKLEYKTIAVNRVQQTVGTSLGQLGIGALGLRGVAGLFLGMTLGQLYAWINLGLKAKELRQPLPKDAPSKWAMAKRYRKMPLLNGPNALLDAVRMNGMMILIGEISLVTLGHFDFAWRMLQVPVSLLQGAISQVFFQKLTTVERGRMEPLVRFVIKRALLFGIGPFIILFLISPWLFPFIFGAEWKEAGYYAQALTPWMCMMLVTSPISTIFIVTESQRTLLIFAAVYCVVPLSILWFTPWTLLPTIFVLGAVMAALLVVNTMLALRVARQYDSSPEPPPVTETEAD